VVFSDPPAANIIAGLFLDRRRLADVDPVVLL
jgi:hypothetical protein